MKLYQLAKSGGVKIWEGTTKGEVIVIRWWKRSAAGVDGKEQMTEQVCKGKNIGKKNETLPEEQAILELERIVEKKMKEGYDTTIKKPDAIDTHKALPSYFAPDKPIVELPPKADPYDGTWIGERKYDGNCILLQAFSGSRVILSRRIEVITPIVTVVPEAVAALKKVPDNSLFIAEITCFDPDGNEDTKKLKGVTSEKSKTEDAYQRYIQLTRDGYTFKVHVFEVIFLAGLDVSKKTFDERCLMTEHIFGKRDIEIFTKKIDDAGKKAGWEGFILRKPDSTYGYSLAGKAGRGGSYKHKYKYSTDAIITGLEKGKGKFKDTYAKFHLKQYYNGQLIDCGNAGPGSLGEEWLFKYTEEVKKWGYKGDVVTLSEPHWFAVELEFKSRHPWKNERRCFEIPIIQRDRPDKPLNECDLEEYEIC